MPRITRSVDIAAAAADVWPLLEDVRRLPEFSASTVAVTDAPERITGTGQTFRQVVRVLAKKWTSEWTVVDYDEGHRLGIEGTVGPGVSYRLTQSLEPLGADRSRLSQDIDYSVPGGSLGRVAAKLGLESRAASEAQAVLEGIRRTAEAAAPPRS